MSQDVTILLVDDDELNLRILDEILTDEQFKTLHAKDGHEAVAMLEVHSEIKLILLDRMMPKMDGMEVMQWINDSEQWAGVPVIMQTAAAEAKQVIDGSATGVYYYLTKPFEPQMVLSIVRSALAKSARDAS